MNADTGTHWFKGHLKDASREECFEFLESQQVGRVVFDDPDGPVALPVNFTVHDEGVVIATSPTSSLSRHAPGQVVAFEVDEIDEFNESGRSVLLRGVASVLKEGRIEDDDRPNPWVEGDRTLLLRISCLQVSGRYLLSA